jgi:hypothetical protein
MCGVIVPFVKTVIICGKISYVLNVRVQLAVVFCGLDII